MPSQRLMVVLLGADHLLSLLHRDLAFVLGRLYDRSVSLVVDHVGDSGDEIEIFRSK